MLNYNFENDLPVACQQCTQLDQKGRIMPFFFPLLEALTLLELSTWQMKACSISKCILWITNQIANTHENIILALSVHGWYKKDRSPLRGNSTSWAMSLCIAF